MKIQNDNTKRPNFNSGLTLKIIKDIKQTNVLKSQADFAKIGAETDFKGKKSVCANFIYAANILYDISEKYKLPLDYVPYSIKVYKKEELEKPGDFLAFAINDSGKVLKNEPPFLGGSVFINDLKSGLFENDFYTTIDYLKKRRSTPHFLANTLHEWFHTIHMNLMYKKYGYEGKCPVLREEYHRNGHINSGLKKYESLDNRDLSLLPESFKKYIGRYGIKSNSMLELFAELMTKITVQALDKDLKVIKNPLDNIPKYLPKEVNYELERILNI